MRCGSLYIYMPLSTTAFSIQKNKHRILYIFKMSDGPQIWDRYGLKGVQFSRSHDVDERNTWSWRPGFSRYFSLIGQSIIMNCIDGITTPWRRNRNGRDILNRSVVDDDQRMGTKEERCFLSLVGICRVPHQHVARENTLINFRMSPSETIVIPSFNLFLQIFLTLPVLAAEKYPTTWQSGGSIGITKQFLHINSVFVVDVLLLLTQCILDVMQENVIASDDVASSSHFELSNYVFHTTWEK